jgi:hypothetical protein
MIILLYYAYPLLSQLSHFSFQISEKRHHETVWLYYYIIHIPHLLSKLSHDVAFLKSGKKSEIVEKASKGYAYITYICISLACFLNYLTFLSRFIYAYPLLAFSTISLFFPDFKKAISWDNLESKWGICII